MRSRILVVVLALVLSRVDSIDAQVATDELTSRELIAFEHLQGGGDRDWQTVRLTVRDDVRYLHFTRAPRDGDRERLDCFQNLGFLFFTSGPDFPEAEFRHLAGTKVQGIAIWRRSLTDEGLRILKHVEQLDSLSLEADFRNPGSMQLTPAGLTLLRNYPTLTDLKLARVQIADDCLEEIGKLSNLTKLYLFHCPKITDAGVAYLSSMTNLQTLTITNDVEHLTSKALIHLKPLTNLTSLGIGWMDVESGDLRHLHGLDNLESLALDSTNLTDAGLEQLSTMDSLKRISITRTKVTDAGMATLGSMRQLEVLSLEGTTITDVGVTSLAVLPKLRELDVSNSSVTDAGMARFAECRSLEKLMLRGTKVSGEAVEALQKRLPNCEVSGVSHRR